MGTLELETSDIKVGYERGMFFACGKARKTIGAYFLNTVYWNVWLGGRDQYQQWLEHEATLRRVPMRKAYRDELWTSQFVPVKISRDGSEDKRDFVSVSCRNDPSLAVLFTSAMTSGSEVIFNFWNLFYDEGVNEGAAITEIEDFKCGRDAIFSLDLPDIWVKAPTS